MKNVQKRNFKDRIEHLQDLWLVSCCRLIDYSQALLSQILLEQHLPLRHNWRRSEKQKAGDLTFMLILNILCEAGDFPSTFTPYDISLKKSNYVYSSTVL